MFLINENLSLFLGATTVVCWVVLLGVMEDASRRLVEVGDDEVLDLDRATLSKSQFAYVLSSRLGALEPGLHTGVPEEPDSSG